MTVFIVNGGGECDSTAEVWDKDPAQHVWRCSRSMYFRVITVGRASPKDYTIQWCTERGGFGVFKPPPPSNF